MPSVPFKANVPSNIYSMYNAVNVIKGQQADDAIAGRDRAGHVSSQVSVLRGATRQALDLSRTEKTKMGPCVYSGSK
jgi:hypothetical protein